MAGYSIVADDWAPASDQRDEIATLERAFAYSAARSDIECYCRAVDEWSERWHDPEWISGSDDREYVDTALRYLELRGLLERHPTKPWVRVRDE